MTSRLAAMRNSRCCCLIASSAAALGMHPHVFQSAQLLLRTEASHLQLWVGMALVARLASSMALSHIRSCCLVLSDEQDKVSRSCPRALPNGLRNAFVRQKGCSMGETMLDDALQRMSDASFGRDFV